MYRLARIRLAWREVRRVFGRLHDYLRMMPKLVTTVPTTRKMKRPPRRPETATNVEPSTAPASSASIIVAGMTSTGVIATGADERAAASVGLRPAATWKAYL